MTIWEAIQTRHSVRSYTSQLIEGHVLEELQNEVRECNAAGGLNIQLVLNDPKNFNGLLAKFRFTGTRNFLVLAGKESADLDEKAGYYGERLVLKAQQLGLNTCWATMFSRKRSAVSLGQDERIVIVVAVGYGETPGVPHKSKPLESLCEAGGDLPHWFRSGMEAAMLAPTALNKQDFLITLSGNTVEARSTGKGVFSSINLGIVKYHFEVGAGGEHFIWQ